MLTGSSVRDLDALVPTIRSGDNGAAVKALQVELNAKRRLNLAVDGVFSTAVRDAVVAFQNHAGIGADGIVGPITWRNLAWHYDYPDFTANLCDQDPDGNGTAANWAPQPPSRNWKQRQDLREHHQGQVGYGDAGFEHGGDIPGHASHDNGMDIDIWPIRTDNAQCTAARITWESATYDRAATRQLVQAVRASAPGPREVHLVQRPDPDQRGPDRRVAGPRQPPACPLLREGPPDSTYTC